MSLARSTPKTASQQFVEENATELSCLIRQIQGILRAWTQYLRRTRTELLLDEAGFIIRHSRLCGRRFPDWSKDSLLASLPTNCTNASAQSGEDTIAFVRYTYAVSVKSYSIHASMIFLFCNERWTSSHVRGTWNANCFVQNRNSPMNLERYRFLKATSSHKKTLS